MLAQPDHEKPGHDDHFRRVESLVQRWLQGRQSLIVLMLELGDEQRRALGPVSLSQRVQAFCEVLMDYVSAGHFEIYDELLAEAESRGSRNLAQGQALFRHLQHSTDAAIRFNDLHEGPEDQEVLANLAHELSELGMALEDRFETEDRMISLLHVREGKTPA